MRFISDQSIIPRCGIGIEGRDRSLLPRVDLGADRVDVRPHGGLSWRAPMNESEAAARGDKRPAMGPPTIHSVEQPPELQLLYETAPIGLAFLSPDCRYLH